MHKQVVPKPNKIKVTGVIMPIINQVETWRNRVTATMTAIPIDFPTISNGCSLIIKMTVVIAVKRFAGTKKEQIATQFWRENSKTGSKSSINLSVYSQY